MVTTDSASVGKPGRPKGRDRIQDEPAVANVLAQFAENARELAAKDSFSETDERFIKRSSADPLKVAVSSVASVGSTAQSRILATSDDASGSRSAQRLTHNLRALRPSSSCVS